MIKVSEQKFPPSKKIYCSSGAVCFQFATNREGEKTLVLEFAHRAESSSGYDWANKAMFQLTHNDLACICAYFLWPWTTYQLQHFNKDAGPKTLTFEQQDGAILATLFAGGRHIRVPITTTDQYFVRNLCLSRLLEIQPQMPQELHLKSLSKLSKSLSTG